MTEHLTSTTTAEQDRETAGVRASGVASDAEKGLLAHGQRRVNLMWEVTQGVAALALIGTACVSVSRGRELAAEFWLLLGIVVNSYFTRTNHIKTGGVGGSDAGPR